MQSTKNVKVLFPETDLIISYLNYNFIDFEYSGDPPCQKTLDAIADYVNGGSVIHSGITFHTLDSEIFILIVDEKGEAMPKVVGADVFWAKYFAVRKEDPPSKRSLSNTEISLILIVVGLLFVLAKLIFFP